MKLWQKNLILILIVVLIAAVPLWLCRDAAFGGADGLAEELIVETHPDYNPGSPPSLSPPAGRSNRFFLPCRQRWGRE